ncbi:hypothetical protein A2954_04040 [Candidatus Roizmanbacteria bacterium RIFCSPLOWO2_01_FULL_37_12]|uniref:Carbohydrate kinase PfkB domain-containing protein n=1 Tax=Candidatus Roizmanbacteria bacterium RIFCSPLOWO2_01_FULL_37_12 TaxID=1802056 RepID=A0A1F7IFN8_9BACT|nr:MAG: hypothetical protein A3D76_03700 [Candidatus Roizmanbacteria bacterium RIFCSPHIGHO2_02_FULL_37_9b]OGK42157.1 MAG: hypothetical protein A2954_04040 [Candidatus Roizmanbacteria bacterium RIFCSPLOWO2_01_FULL_37_12]
MFDVTGLGNCCVDLIGIVNQLPKENTKKDITSFKQFVGSPVVNALLTLSHLGCKTSIISSVGNDHYGQFIKQTFIKNNINIQNLREDSSESSVHFVVIAKKTQSRTIFKKKNHLKVLAEFSPFHKFTIQNSKILVLDRNVDNEQIKAINWAKKHKVKVAYDPSDKYNSFTLKMIQLADIFIAPLGFINHLKNKSNPEHALKELWMLNKKIVVLTLGPKGSMATDGKSIVYEPRINQVRVVDTNGAGDVYYGAFVYGVLKNWNLKKKLTFANKIAALKCSILGNDFKKLNLKKYR